MKVAVSLINNDDKLNYKGKTLHFRGQRKNAIFSTNDVDEIK